ncbi:MAG TPA: YceD family protein [Gammaproteobacteria bacterium]|nr:YceD family protein [Gammaproteobacteria bacterium]
MSEPLPERIDAERLAQEHTRVAGVIPLHKMPRLTQSLMASAGEAAVEAEFALGSDGRSVVRGHATATVQLTCQRCLDNMDWPLEAQFALALVRDEDDAASLPGEYEPLLWPDGTGSLPALVEEELLLALPVAARHPDPAECGPVTEMMRQESEHESQEREDNPFTVLNQLKSGRREQ